MHVYRMLVTIGPAVWTYVIAAATHADAWQVLSEELPRPDRELAFLEELEVTGEQRATGRPRVLHAWRQGAAADTDAPRATGSSGRASRAA